MCYNHQELKSKVKVYRVPMQHQLLIFWLSVAGNNMVIRFVELNSRICRYFNWLFGWNCIVYYRESMLSYMKNRNIQFALFQIQPQSVRI